MFPYSYYITNPSFMKTEYSRLKLLEAALAMYHEEVRENAKAVVFHVGEMERMVEDYRSRKTQN